jgi:hypothetical protein
MLLAVQVETADDLAAALIDDNATGPLIVMFVAKGRRFEKD